MNREQLAFAYGMQLAEQEFEKQARDPEREQALQEEAHRHKWPILGSGLRGGAYGGLAGLLAGGATGAAAGLPVVPSALAGMGLMGLTGLGMGTAAGSYRAGKQYGLQEQLGEKPTDSPVTRTLLSSPLGGSPLLALYGKHVGRTAL